MMWYLEFMNLFRNFEQNSNSDRVSNPVRVMKVMAI